MVLMNWMGEVHRALWVGRVGTPLPSQAQGDISLCCIVDPLAYELLGCLDGLANGPCIRVLEE